MQLSTINLAITRRYTPRPFGEGAALALDFTNYAMDSRVTFSRASNATVYGADGTLRWAPHNLLLQSQTFDASSWTKTRSSVTANVAVAPDGTMTADKLVEDSTASATHLTFQGATVTTGLTYTYSVYAKGGERSIVRLLSLTAGFSADAHFNLSTGTVLSTTSGTSAIQSVGNGWYRCSVTNTATSSVSIGFALYLVQPGPVSAYTGDGVSGLFLWGAQLETNPSASLYISTSVRNMVAYTESFDNAAWTKTNCTVTANGATAPDGTVSGDKVVWGNGIAIGSVQLTQQIAASASTAYTMSVYAKASELTSFRLGFIQRSAGPTYLGEVNYIFDLSAGTVTASATAGTTPTSASGAITNVGGGWYRCSVTATTTSAAAFISASIRNNVTGDGASGLFVWGFQLSDSGSVDPYLPNATTVPASAITYGRRLDYDPVTREAEGLLIEEQRTNSIRNNTMVGAAAGSPGTVPTNWLAATAGTTGVAISVAGVGTENGISYIDFRLNGTSDATGGDYFVANFEGFTSVAALNGQTWTLSSYVSLAGGSLSGLSAVQLRLSERSSAGSNLAESRQSITPTSAPLAGQRQSFVRANSNASTAYLYPSLVVTRVPNAVIDVTFRIGLPQLEQGAFATSVIPTTGAAATRSADVARVIGSNFFSVYNQTEGTLCSEGFIPPGLSSFPSIGAAVSDGTTNNQMATYAYTTGVYVNTRIGGVSGSDTGSVVPPTSGAACRFAYGYKASDFTSALNGTQTGTNGTNGVPTVNQMRIGTNGGGTAPANTWIRRIAYYNTRRTNGEVTALTA